MLYLNDLMVTGVSCMAHSWYILKDDVRPEFRYTNIDPSYLQTHTHTIICLILQNFTPTHSHTYKISNPPPLPPLFLVCVKKSRLTKNLDIFGCKKGYFELFLRVSHMKKCWQLPLHEFLEIRSLGPSPIHFYFFWPFWFRYIFLFSILLF